jgi:hypothetical protein
MTRLTLALAVWIGFFSAAPASLTPPREPLRLSDEVFRAGVGKLSAVSLRPEAGRKTLGEFAVTEQTEVLLDGKPCPYAEVPATAVIIKMEVAEDKITVLKIHFRTRK